MTKPKDNEMGDKITFTLREIRKNSPCKDGWEKLYKSLGGTKKYGLDTPITAKQIIESNGVEDAIWCACSRKDQASLWRHFAVDCAEMFEHLMIDDRSKNALRVARRHADGLASDEELDAARDVAWAAARDAARDAAWAAARDVAWDVAWAAAWAADRFAARVAALVAAWDAIGNLFSEYCRTGERVDWQKFLGVAR